MPSRGMICLLSLANLIMLAGCDPFDNAENMFPLPENVWDRAVPSGKHKVFEIKNVSAQEFLNIKTLLLSKGYSEHKRDFNFAPSSAKTTPATVKSAGSILLIKGEPEEREIRAAMYIEKQNVLLLGLGTLEKHAANQ